MAEEADIVVVGLGVGGEEVAGRLAQAGLRVIGIENTLVGGTCPYWGCIPSKMMIRASNLLAEGGRIDGMSGTAEISPDWSPVATRIRDEATDDWNDRVAVERFTGKGGIFIRGRAKLTASDRVAVGDREIKARQGVVIATGTVAVIPLIDGLAGTPFWTNKEAIEAKQAPESLIVLGGGAIGVELAQAFARFGTVVTVVESSGRLLSVEEPESSELAERALNGDGIEVRTGVRAIGVRHDGETFTVITTYGDLTAQRLLVAVGRRVDLSGIGADSAGLDPKAKSLAVDERMRAGERLWGVGDVTGHGAFTHMAMYQAGIAVRDILGEPGPPADYRATPRVTFTDPEIGAVGLTEAQARDQGIAVATGFATTASSTRGWIHKAGNDGFIKVVADTDRGVLVGATSAGPVGGEVLGALAVAVHAETPVETLRNMIFAYPTFHRGISDALNDLS